MKKRNIKNDQGLGLNNYIKEKNNMKKEEFTNKK